MFFSRATKSLRICLPETFRQAFICVSLILCSPFALPAFAQTQSVLHTTSFANNVTPPFAEPPQTEQSEQEAPKTQTRMLKPLDETPVTDDQQTQEPVQAPAETESAVAETEATDQTEPADTRNESDITSVVDQVARNMNDKQLYQLAYQLPVGYTLKFSTEHFAATEMRMAGDSEKSTMRSESEFSWEVKSVDSLGNMTFVYSIEWTKDFAQVGEGEPAQFDSRDEGEVPAGYEATARTIGIPLAVISINPAGQIIDKKSSLPDFNFGVGETTIPLPSDLVPVGYEWYAPRTLNANDEGRPVVLKARTHYELSRVKLPNAYIAFRTEVLTPIESPTVESQIMQQMTSGYVVFDIQRGVLVKREAEWDEQVQGIHGAPDSYLDYVGKWTEKLLTIGETTDENKSAQANVQTADALELRTKDGKPVMRK